MQRRKQPRRVLEAACNYVVTKDNLRLPYEQLRAVVRSMLDAEGGGRPRRFLENWVE